MCLVAAEPVLLKDACTLPVFTGRVHGYCVAYAPLKTTTVACRRVTTIILRVQNGMGWNAGPSTGGSGGDRKN